MSEATPNGYTPSKPVQYDVTALLRSSALQPGQQVRVVLGKDDSVGKDGGFYVVTDAADKNGNPMLLGKGGKTAYADPSTVFALLV